MNSVIESLKNHRSIRRFSDQALGSDVLSNLVEAGQAASTSSYIQAVSIIRVKDPVKLDALVALSGNQKYIAGAAEFLVFCADLYRNKQRVGQLNDGEADYGWTEQFLAATVDVALVAQNIVVAAESEGLGCCYIGGLRNDPQTVTDLLALPELVYPVFGLCIGYPDQSPETKPRLPVDAILHQNQYQFGTQESMLVNDYDEHVRQYYIERTKGKLSFSWSEQMAKQASSQTRPYMRKFLNKQGFMLK